MEDLAKKAKQATAVISSFLGLSSEAVIHVLPPLKCTYKKVVFTNVHNFVFAECSICAELLNASQRGLENINLHMKKCDQLFSREDITMKELKMECITNSRNNTTENLHSWFVSNKWLSCLPCIALTETDIVTLETNENNVYQCQHCLKMFTTKHKCLNHLKTEHHSIDTVVLTGSSIIGTPYRLKNKSLRFTLDYATWYQFFESKVQFAGLPLVTSTPNQNQIKLLNATMQQNGRMATLISNILSPPPLQSNHSNGNLIRFDETQMFTVLDLGYLDVNSPESLVMMKNNLYPEFLVSFILNLGIVAARISDGSVYYSITDILIIKRNLLWLTPSKMNEKCSFNDAESFYAYGNLLVQQSDIHIRNEAGNLFHAKDKNSHHFLNQWKESTSNMYATSLHQFFLFGSNYLKEETNVFMIDYDASNSNFKINVFITRLLVMNELKANEFIKQFIACLLIVPTGTNSTISSIQVQLEELMIDEDDDSDMNVVQSTYLYQHANMSYVAICFRAIIKAFQIVLLSNLKMNTIDIRNLFTSSFFYKFLLQTLGHINFSIPQMVKCLSDYVPIYDNEYFDVVGVSSVTEGVDIYPADMKRVALYLEDKLKTLLEDKLKIKDLSSKLHDTSFTNFSNRSDKKGIVRKQMNLPKNDFPMQILEEIWPLFIAVVIINLGPFFRSCDIGTITGESFSMMNDCRVKLTIYSTKNFCSVPIAFYSLDRFSQHVLSILANYFEVHLVNNKNACLKTNAILKEAFLRLNENLSISSKNLRKIVMILDKILQNVAPYGTQINLHKSAIATLLQNTLPNANEILTAMASYGSMHSTTTHVGEHYVNEKKIQESDEMTIKRSQGYRNCVLKREDINSSIKSKSIWDWTILGDFAQNLASTLVQSHKFSSNAGFTKLYKKMLLSCFNESSITYIAAPCSSGKSSVVMFAAQLLLHLDHTYNKPLVILLVACFNSVLETYLEITKNPNLCCFKDVKVKFFSKNPGFAGNDNTNLVLVTPEQFESDEFLKFLATVEVVLIFFDEAHDLILESSYRKSVRAIGDQLYRITHQHSNQFVKIICMSGTLSDSMQKSISSRFSHSGSIKKITIPVSIMSPINPQLVLTGKNFKDDYEAEKYFKENTLKNFALQAQSNWKMIVFCVSKKRVQELFEELSNSKTFQDMGFKFGYYHSTSDCDSTLIAKIQAYKDSFISLENNTVNCLLVTTASCSAMNSFRCIHSVVLAAAYNLIHVIQLACRSSRFPEMPDPVLEILNSEKTCTWMESNSTEIFCSIDPGLLQQERRELQCSIGFNSYKVFTRVLFDSDCSICSVQYLVFVITGQEVSVCGKCLVCKNIENEELLSTNIAQQVRQLWSQYNLHVRASASKNSIELNQELDELLPKKIFTDIQQRVPLYSGIQSSLYGGTSDIIATKIEWIRTLQEITASKNCIFCQDATCTQLACLRKLFPVDICEYCFSEVKAYCYSSYATLSAPGKKGIMSTIVSRDCKNYADFGQNRIELDSSFSCCFATHNQNECNRHSYTQNLVNLLFFGAYVASTNDNESTRKENINLISKGFLIQKNATKKVLEAFYHVKTVATAFLNNKIKKS